MTARGVPPTVASMRRWLVLAVGGLVAGLAGACADDTATQVLVVLRAEAGLEAARALAVEVTRADGTVAYQATHALADPRPEPLARIPLVPLDDDATRTFRVRATLLDAAGAPLAEVEASGGYTAGALRELNLWFERACLGVLDCGRGRTCSGGTCVGACFAPAEPGSEAVARPTCGECQECRDRVCAARADDSPCGCAGDRCQGGACAVARPAAAVFGGHLHTCAGSGGSLYCWGSNRVGQLGTGGASTTAPVRVDLDGWAEGTAAQDHTCAVKIGGGRACWGWNGHAQLGLGRTENRATSRPVDAPDGDPAWSALASGWFHTCGLTRDRRVACWGGNGRGAAGQPLAMERVESPAFVDGAADWTAVAAGGFHACGLKSDGTLWCWGMNESGELGLGDAADRAAPAPVSCVGGACASGWTGLGAGSFHTCGIRGAGELWCWGGGLNGQLGVGAGTSEDSAVPQKVLSDARWRAVTGGASHTCGLQEDGSLWCWGRNDHGQLGLGDTQNRFEPAPLWVPGAGEWIRLGAGREHTCAIRGDRSLWCWGDNSSGQLGLGSEAPSFNRPTRVCLPGG